MKKDELDAQQVEEKIIQQKLKQQIDRNKTKILSLMLKTNDPKQLIKYKNKLLALEKHIEEFKSDFRKERLEILKDPGETNKKKFEFIFTPTKSDNRFGDFVNHFLKAVCEYNRLITKIFQLNLKNEDSAEIAENVKFEENQSQNVPIRESESLYSEISSQKMPQEKNSNAAECANILSVISKNPSSYTCALHLTNKSKGLDPVIRIKLSSGVFRSIYEGPAEMNETYDASGRNHLRFRIKIDARSLQSLVENNISNKDSILYFENDLKNHPGKSTESVLCQNYRVPQTKYAPKSSLALPNQSANQTIPDSLESRSRDCMESGIEYSNKPNVTPQSKKITDTSRTEKLYIFKNNKLLETMNHLNHSQTVNYYTLKEEMRHFFTFLRKYSHNTSGLFVPKFLWDNLFPYQQEGVSWMYDLYVKGKGCLLADEMGLGKTLQVISLLSGLFICNLLIHCLIITPSTILKQWVVEFKKYFPFVRIILLHKSHTSSINQTCEEISRFPSVVLVSYDGFKTYKYILSKFKFTVVVLDEGHKIKNKNSEVSQVVGQITCRFKVVLTGTPIQNNLQELWAIFNFINQGLLGTFDEFVTEFEDPIKRGGFVCASESTVIKAYKKSRLLRSLIKPYFLRRLKSSVAQQLPDKLDKVVFCKLSDIQESMYKSFLESDYVFQILAGKGNFLGGIIRLRKICNHPYLRSKDPQFLENVETFSGKLLKTHKLLLKWRKEGRKVLIFTQLLDMLELFEIYFKIHGFSYLKMEGRSALRVREDSIEQFNADPDVFIFLMTTRVGGLGLNLVGASRVILYDPDWNPSNDSQAKERAWRYGQELDVQIYRMISAGTVEEKIYQRQVFKSTLSRKILVDPKLSKFFEKDDVNDLFSYDNNCAERTELMNIASTEHQDLEFLSKDIPDDIKQRFVAFKTKDKLSDEEMIEYITLRESHEKE